MTSYSGHQPGSPQKAATAIIDVVTSSGLAAGREVPLRIVLGSDAIATVKAKCEDTLKALGEWEGIGGSTDF